MTHETQPKRDPVRVLAAPRLALGLFCAVLTAAWLLTRSGESPGETRGEMRVLPPHQWGFGLGKSTRKTVRVAVLPGQAVRLVSLRMAVAHRANPRGEPQLTEEVWLCGKYGSRLVHLNGRPVHPGASGQDGRPQVTRSQLTVDVSQVVLGPFDVSNDFGNRRALLLRVPARTTTLGFIALTSWPKVSVRHEEMALAR